MQAVHEQVSEALLRRILPINPGPLNTEILSLEVKAELSATESTMFLTRNRDGDGDLDYLSMCCQCTYKATAREALLQPGSVDAMPPYNRLAKWQISLTRDVVGNPFRPDPPVERSSLIPMGGVVQALARAAYDERVLPVGTLDPACLCILADALEDASCTGAEILGHLREPGPHWRGCRALDLLLGKG
jgi:hypothetical protein